MSDLRSTLDAFLLGEIAAGTFPSASYLVGDARSVIAEGAHGLAVAVPLRLVATTGTIYDCASITKPLVTTVLALRCVADRLFALDDRVAETLTELRGTDQERITFRQLLTHSSGLEAWWGMYCFGDDAGSYLRTIGSRPLAYEGGTKVIYSDLGFMLLFLAVQRVRGRGGIVLAAEQVLAPLGLTTAAFNPPPAWRPRIAATEWGQRFEMTLAAARKIACNRFRQELMWGVLNDGNSWGMGGYAGTAGLFATARDVWTLARTWIDRKETLLPNALVDEATRNLTAGLGENRGLGWQLRTAISEPFPEDAFGHTGFTGTSVWVDRTRETIAVLMTNRIHPSAFTVGMQSARRRFHELVAQR